MDKRIFEEHTVTQAPDFQPKREFDDADITPDVALSTEDNTAFAEEQVKPTRFWVRLLLVGMVLLGVGVVAQSVQWLVDAWQQHQWIYVLFASVFLVVSLAGIGAIVKEWRKLVWLRKHYYDQQASRQFWVTNSTASGEMATQFCQHIATNMAHNPAVRQSVTRDRKSVV